MTWRKEEKREKKEKTTRKEETEKERKDQSRLYGMTLVRATCFKYLVNCSEIILYNISKPFWVLIAHMLRFEFREPWIEYCIVFKARSSPCGVCSCKCLGYLWKNVTCNSFVFIRSLLFIVTFIFVFVCVCVGGVQFVSTKMIPVLNDVHCSSI